MVHPVSRRRPVAVLAALIVLAAGLTIPFPTSPAAAAGGTPAAGATDTTTTVQTSDGTNFVTYHTVTGDRTGEGSATQTVTGSWTNWAVSKYVAGSAKAPTGYVVEFSIDNGATWTATEPAAPTVTNIRARQTAATTTDASGATIATTTPLTVTTDTVDGTLVTPNTAPTGGNASKTFYMPNLNPNAMYATRAAQEYQIYCVDRFTGASCGTVVNTSAGTGYIQSAYGGVGIRGTRVYSFVVTGGTEKVLCTDLATGTSCGLKATWTGAMGAGFNNLFGGPELIFGTRMYSLNVSLDRIRCFDMATETSCGEFPAGFGFTGGAIWNYPQKVGDRFYYRYGTTAPRCFDTTTNTACTAPSVTVSGSQTRTAFDYLDATGALIGLCYPRVAGGTAPAGAVCYRFSTPGTVDRTLTGFGVGTSTATGNGSATDGFSVGSRYYALKLNGSPNNSPGGIGGVECWDFATNALCSGFNNTTTASTSQFTDMEIDPSVPNCAWVTGGNTTATGTNGVSGIVYAKSFNLLTGADGCGGGPATVTGTPQLPVSVSQCDPSQLTTLDAVTVTAPSGGSFSGGTVTVRDSSSIPIPGYVDVPLDGSGTATFSGLTSAQTGANPSVKLAFTSATPGSYAVSYRYTAPDPTLCFKLQTTAPTICGDLPLSVTGVNAVNDGTSTTTTNDRDDTKLVVTGGSNLVKNNSFENPGSTGWGTPGTGFTYGDEAQWGAAQTAAGIPTANQWYRGGANGASVSATTAVEIVNSTWAATVGGGTAHDGTSWYDQIGAVGATPSQYLYQDLPVVAGRTYRLTYWHSAARDMTANGYMGVGANAGQAAGVDALPSGLVSFPDTATATATAPAAWKRVTGTWTATSNQARIVLVPQSTKNSAGTEQILGNWFDNVSFAEEPNPTQCALDLTKYVVDSTGVKRDADLAPGVYRPVGSTATFLYEVTKASQASPYAVSAPVSVRDDSGTAGVPGDDVDATYLSGDTDGDGLVDTGEVWVYRMTATVPSGAYRNTATLNYTYLGAPTTDTDIANLVGHTLPFEPRGACSSPAEENLIVNGDFESPVGTDGAEQSFTLIPGWTTNNTNGFAIHRNVGGWTAPSGAQFVETNNGTSGGVVSQDVPVTPGRTYNLIWSFRRTPVADAGGGDALRVDFRNAATGLSVKPTYTDTQTSSAVGWQDESTTITVPAGVTSLRLEFSSSFASTTDGARLDNVRLLDEPTADDCAQAMTKFVVDRSGAKQDADSAPGVALAVGDNATFRYEVTHGTPTVTASNGTTVANGYGVVAPSAVTDDNGTPTDTADDFAAPYLAGDTNGNGLVDSGETWVYQAVKPVVTGQYTNTARTDYLFQGTAKAQTQTANYFGFIDPTVTVRKEMSIDGGATWLDANATPLAVTLEGTPVKYRYSLSQQSGANTELSAVTLIDDMATPADTSDDTTLTVSGGDTDGDGRLDPNETWTYSLDATARLGTNVNTASGTATSPLGTETFADIAGYTGVPQPADVAVTMTSSSASVTAGGSVTYTLTVTNSGTGTADNVQLVDSPAAGIVLGTVGGDCTALPCTFASLAPGETRTVTVAATLTAAGDAMVTNAATVSTSTLELDTSNNSASVDVAVNVEADLRLANTFTPATIAAGSASSIVLTVTNDGPTTSGTFSVLDTIPSGLTLGTLPAGCSLLAGVVTCTGSALAVGASTTFTIPVTAATDVVSVNTATVVSSDDGNPGNDTASATLTVTPVADLSVTKANAAPAIAGQVATFTIVTTNAGPSAAAGVTVVDTPPAGFTFNPSASSAGCAFAAGVVTCTVGSLASGATATTMIGYTVAPDQAAGTYSGAVTVATTTTETTLANNSATATVSITQSADLEVVKTSLNGPSIDKGSNQTWQVVITNFGPSTATGVSMFDTIPNPLAASSIFWTSTQGSCTRTNSDLTCPIGSIPPGGSVTLTVGGRVPSGAETDSTVNTALISSTSFDPVSDNNSSTDVVVVKRRSVIAFSKAVSDPTPPAGGVITYSIQAFNGGPSDSPGSVVTDNLPAGITPLTATANLGATCSISGQDVTCTPVNITDQQTLIVTVTAKVDPSLAPNTMLWNAARFDNTVDPPLNAAAEILTTRQSNLTVTKTGPPTIVAGAPATWTITAKNDGPSAATDVSITDLGGPNLTITGVSASPSAGVTCSVATQSCSIPTLAAGATVTISVVTAVSATATGSVSNSVVYSSPDDPSIDPVTPPSVSVTRAADLAVTGSASASSVLPGGGLVYTFAVRNNGPTDLSAADAATFTTTLPAGLTATALPPDCTAAGQTITCVLGPLASGASVNASVPVVLSPTFSGSQIVETGSASSLVSDPDGANNSATVTTPVTPLADLSVTKTTTTPFADLVAGKWVTYEMTVTNGGPMSTPNVVLTDVVPAGLSFVSSDDAACAPAGSVVECTWPTLDAGDTRTVALTYQIDPSYTGAVNTAGATSTASVAGEVLDPNAGNNSASVTDTITADVGLSITMTTDRPITAGANVKFTITVANSGPSAAADVTVRDEFPVPLGIVSLPAGCTTVGALVTCDAGTLAPGASASFVIEVSVPAGSPDGTAVTNVATASTPTDPAADVAAIVDGVISARADLAVTMTGPTTFTPGEQATYTISVVNNGSSDALGVALTDLLPGTYVSSTTDAGTCSGASVDLVCALATVPVGTTINITVTVATPPGAGDISNTAKVAATTIDPNLADNEATVTATATPENDVSVTKTLVGGLVAGTSATYRIDVANAGPSTATNVTVVDPVPTGLTLQTVTAAGGTCDTTVSCTIPVVAPGTIAPITITAFVAAPTPVGTIITNTATATVANDSDTSNNTGSTTDKVTAIADLGVTMTLDTAPVVAGGDVVWTVTVTNGGPSVATEVALTDLLDPRFSNVRISDPACTVTGGGVDCLWPSLVNSGTTVFTITATLAPDATGTLSNTVEVSSPWVDPDLSNNQATTALAPIEAIADLRLDKSSPASMIAGADAAYTLTATNDGPSATAPTTITDTLPAGLTFASGAGCSLAGADVICTVPALAPGGVHDFDLVVAVADPAPAAVANTATVAPAPGSTDPNLVNNTASSSLVEPAAESDLAITASLDTMPVVAGQPVVFTLTTTNNGPSQAANVVVADTLDPVFSEITVDDPACTIAGQVITCAYGTLASGAIRTVQVTATVAPAATGTISTTATVTTDTVDPDLANNVAVTPPAPITTSADVSVVNTRTVALVAGRPTAWTVVVTNDGPSSATGVTMTDTLPAGLANVATTTPGCTITGNVLSCDLGDLAADATITVEITADVPASASGTVTTTATVTSGTPDPDSANNTSVAGPDAIARVSDLSIEKLAPASVVPGTDAIWTINVTNAGPSNSGATTVTDTLPVGLSFVPSAGCTASGADVTCDVPVLAVGQSFARTLTTQVAPGVTAAISNTATVQKPTGWTDPVSGNNTSTADSGTPAPKADLSVTKILTTDPIVAGRDVEWTVTVTNNGPSVARGVSVVDTLAATLTFRSAVPSVGTCANVAGAVTCNLGDLDPAGTATVKIRAFLDPDATGTVSNTAVADTTTPDPTPGNDTATAGPSPITTSADVSIVKTLDTDPVIAGTDVQFIITVVNDGPSSARAVKVTDELPAGLTFVSASGTGATCTHATGVVTCTLGDLAVGAVTEITLVAHVDPGMTGDLSNTASVTSTTPDPDPGDNDGTTPDEPVTAVADVATTVAIDTAPIVAGRALTATITVTNHGPSTARDVKVENPVPASLLGAMVTGDGTCDIAAGVLACDLGDLDPSDPVTITLTGTVDPSATGTFTNTATSTATTTDPTPTNNTGTAAKAITTSARVTYTKDVVGELVPGTDATFTLSATNQGPSTALDVTMVDTLDDVFTDIRATTSTGECTVVGQTVTCSFGTLMPNPEAAVTATITARLSPSTTDAVTNSAEGSSTTPDPDPEDNTPTVGPLPVHPTADLGILKTAPKALVPGTAATWRLTVGNDGPSRSPATVVTDTLPTGLAFASGAGCSAVGQAVTCTVPAMDPGATHTIDLVTDVTEEVGTGVANTAKVVVPEGLFDPALSNNTFTTDPLDPTPDADLGVSIAPVGAVEAGRPAVWRVTAVNYGPSAAEGAKVKIVLDPALTFTAADWTPCTLVARTVICDVGDMPVVAPVSVTALAGRTVSADAAQAASTGVVTIDLTTAVDPAKTGSVTVQAEVGASTPDSVGTNNVAPATAPVVVNADLATLKTGPGTLEAGRDAVWTITVTNEGPAVATDVVVTDVLDARLSFVSSDPATCSASVQTVTCGLGSLSPSESVTFTLTTHVAASATGELSNSAIAKSPTADPEPDNDQPVTPPVPITVDGPVAFVMSTSTPQVMVGDIAVFDMSVTGVGPADASGVAVVAALPVGFEFVAEGSGSRCAGGTTVTCTVASLPVGTTVTSKVLAKATVAGTHITTAKMTAATMKGEVTAAVALTVNAAPVPTTTTTTAKPTTTTAKPTTTTAKPATTTTTVRPTPPPERLSFTGGRLGSLLGAVALVLIAVGLPLAARSRRRRS